MILQAESLIEYGYLPLDLPPRSGKPILAACELCGEIREIRKDSYHPLCISCSLKGRIVTEEHKAKQSAAMKGKLAGKKNPWFGKKGENHSKWKGGMKLARARADAKRDRKLGYVLLAPLKEGEVGHHFTNIHVIGIPVEVHEKLSGYKRRKHRTKVLQWLKVNDKKKYEIVLCILAKEPLHMLYKEVTEG